ncbi:glutaredoxin family protein [Saccharothrix obliqua]|uniref:glutaredoxin family protein n=1 Tax=Saccharothrix obliqua TaxID=2861747 RepID=UPI001C5E8DCA|nr:glutaredoxin family protein [Saccharothrix obliqua]MBW4720081.1 glutaredoxin family protein [Saccharothrix obliqua]
MGETGEIVLYGADWCGDCRRAKAWLRENEVPFTEVDVEHDDVARDKAVEIAGGRKNIPVIVLPGGGVLIEPTNSQLAEAVAALG